VPQEAKIAEAARKAKEEAEETRQYRKNLTFKVRFQRLWLGILQDQTRL
jgi:hypothetical protein